MINKSLIDKMLAMPDDKLLAMMKIILSGSGITLSGDKDKKGKTVDEKTLRKLRSVLAEITDGDIERVTYLAEVYQNGG
ncbi:MAG: hypothetical protein J6N32_13200 [Clostridia bacterium]|nr:hypothetical protein [Clostridia bacterium]MBO5126669.1 hypothetical protein [Clostridia bacterium]MBP3294703.1 hypothetical protein [Clostridia bacterium]